jgi:hypothetical protein
VIAVFVDFGVSHSRTARFYHSSTVKTGFDQIPSRTGRDCFSDKTDVFVVLLSKCIGSVIRAVAPVTFQWTACDLS